MLRISILIASLISCSLGDGQYDVNSSIERGSIPLNLRRLKGMKKSKSKSKSKSKDSHSSSHDNHDTHDTHDSHTSNKKKDSAPPPKKSSSKKNKSGEPESSAPKSDKDQPYEGNDPLKNDMGVNKAQSQTMDNYGVENSFKSPDNKPLINKKGANGKSQFHEVMPDGSLKPINGRLPKGTVGPKGKVRSNGKPTSKAKMMSNKGQMLTMKNLGKAAGAMTGAAMFLIIPSFLGNTGAVDQNHEGGITSMWLQMLGVGDYKTTTNSRGIEVWDLEKGALGADGNMSKDPCGNFIDKIWWDQQLPRDQDEMESQDYFGAQCLSPYMLDESGLSKWVGDTFMGCMPNSKINSRGFSTSGDGYDNTMYDCHGNSVDTDEIFVYDYADYGAYFNGLDQPDGPLRWQAVEDRYLPQTLMDEAEKIKFNNDNPQPNMMFGDCILDDSCFSVSRTPTSCDEDVEWDIPRADNPLSGMRECYVPMDKRTTLIAWYYVVQNYIDTFEWDADKWFLDEELDYIIEDCQANGFNWLHDVIEIPGCGARPEVPMSPYTTALAASMSYGDTLVVTETTIIGNPTNTVYYDASNSSSNESNSSSNESNSSSNESDPWGLGGDDEDDEDDEWGDEDEEEDPWADDDWGW
eukprot:GHVH01007304.1.p1 GENE.GHVH01007304.1~~GHVH01007304.1.p1  ORF type:complete len:634 (-),score=115.51 GHVH01007304.1:854-2755(-)